jgi:hypothetical protein
MYSDKTGAIFWFMLGSQGIVKLAVKERMETLLFPLDNLIPIYITWNKERGLELLVTSLNV